VCTLFGVHVGLDFVPVFCLDHLCWFKSVLGNIGKNLSLSDMDDETYLVLTPHPPICDNFCSHIVPVMG